MDIQILKIYKTCTCTKTTGHWITFPLWHSLQPRLHFIAKKKWQAQKDERRTSHQQVLLLKSPISHNVKGFEDTPLRACN